MPTLTDTLRTRLKAVAGVCTSCGGPGIPFRTIAKQSGTTASTICRFLQGKTINSTSLDRLVAWIEKKENG
jgi:hypothetical protein